MEKFKERTGIYHEHQEGALCAQHALNSLLQNQMFLADSLADIARELDKEEISVLNDDVFQSENMDDTGFFNIQVLQRAMKMFDIELVPFGSQEPVAQQARQDCSSIQAYICNFGMHWFTIRRFGNQYFDLNSMYNLPIMIPNQTLSLYLNMIQESGYSVFVVDGTIPKCLADVQLANNPISYYEYRLLTKDLPKYCINLELHQPPGKKGKQDENTVMLPPYIINQLKKNPKDPQLQEIIGLYLPEGMIVQGILDDRSSVNPEEKYGSSILISQTIMRNRSDLIGSGCNCRHCQLQSKMSMDDSNLYDVDDSFFDDTLSPRNGPTEPNVLKCTVVTKNSANRNEARVRSQRVIMIARTHRQQTVLQEYEKAYLTELRYLEIERKRMQVLNDILLSSTDTKQIEEINAFYDSQIDNLEKEIFDNAIADSLAINNSEQRITEVKSELNSEKALNSSKPESQSVTNKIPPVSETDLPDATKLQFPNESELATSNFPSTSIPINPALTLTVNSKEVPENIDDTSNINSTPAPTETPKVSPLDLQNTLVNTEPVVIESLSTKNIRQEKDPVNSLPAQPEISNPITVEAELKPSVDIENISITISPLSSTKSELTTNNTSSLPTTPNLSSTIDTSSNTTVPKVPELTIEELRERRLKLYGNKDRSIISEPVFDD